MTRRYGLQHKGRWLLPPAFDLKEGSLTDDSEFAWAVTCVDAAQYRQTMLRQAFGVNTTICLIPYSHD